MRLLLDRRARRGWAQPLGHEPLLEGAFVYRESLEQVALVEGARLDQGPPACPRSLNPRRSPRRHRLAEVEERLFGGWAGPARRACPPEKGGKLVARVRRAARYRKVAHRLKIWVTEGE